MTSPVCASCGAQPREGARFCGACGAPVASVSLPPPRGLSSRPGRVLAVALAALAAAAVAAVVVVRSGSPGAIRPRKGEGWRAARLPEIEVDKGNELASAKIDGARGGVLKGADGVEITIPAGAWAGERRVALREARVEAPPVKLGYLGVGTVPTARRAWFVEHDGPQGLFAREVTVTVPLGASALLPVVPLISVDGRAWRSVDFGASGGKLTFTTRHFSPFQLIELRMAASPWMLGALGAAALLFLVVERADELPHGYHKDAPFTGIPGLDSGPFEIYWSRKLPGVDVSTGFHDQRGYLRALDEIARRYRDTGGCSGLGAARSCRAEINEARRTYLMPPQVRAIEEALDFAHGYIESRKFPSPAFRLPVYVVPAMDGTASGYLYNPYVDRRYMVMAPTGDASRLHATALHELFHHYQSGYAFFDRNDLLPMAEASATLLEREAAGYYAKKLSVNLLPPDLNNAFFDVYARGIDGPDEGTEDALQAHGYGLSWFIEYLRDRKYGGDKEGFHRSMMHQWGATYLSAHHKTLRWAAGGTEYALGEALDSFAFEEALPGMTRNNTLGRRYFPQNPGAVYHKPFADVDVTTSPFVRFGAKIPGFSIQYYRVEGPGRSGAQVVLRFPRAWTSGRPGRSVYLGQEAEQSATLRTLKQAQVEAEGAQAHVQLRPERERYVFVVDKGNEPPRWWWQESLPPASAFVLEPPSNVKGTSDLSWERPPAAGQGDLRGVFRVYAGDKLVAEVSDRKTSTSLDAASLPAGAVISMSWAVEAGTQAGRPVHVESARSGSKPSGVSVALGALPAGWSETRHSGWAAGAASWKDLRVRNETRLVLRAGRSSPDPGASSFVFPWGEFYAALFTSTRKVEQLQAECPPETESIRRMYSCFVLPGATATTIGGYPAYRSDFGSTQKGPGPTGTLDKNVSFLVDVGGGQYLLLLALGGCASTMPAGQPECPARAAAMLAEAESIARGVKIERR